MAESLSGKHGDGGDSACGSGRIVRDNGPQPAALSALAYAVVVVVDTGVDSVVDSVVAAAVVVGFW